jgi:hypothetical protein
LDLFKKHDILVGTAHAFQGEERDIVLLSCVVDNNSHSNILRFLEKPDVFNVSITRAKNLLLVYLSVDQKTLLVDSLLRKYLSHKKEAEKKSLDMPDNKIHDQFASEVQAALQRKGIKSYVAHPVAGFMMDLIAIKNEHSIGIDLIGYPGDFVEVYSLDRYKMFKRAGFDIFPLPYMRWKMEKQKCLDKLSESFFL